MHRFIGEDALDGLPHGAPAGLAEAVRTARAARSPLVSMMVATTTHRVGVGQFLRLRPTGSVEAASVMFPQVWGSPFELLHAGLSGIAHYHDIS
jgi:hypothetical protein